MHTPISKELMRQNLKLRKQQLARLLGELEELSSCLEETYYRPGVNFSHFRLATEFLRHASNNFDGNVTRILNNTTGELE